jgi:hypothetical protein
MSERHFFDQWLWLHIGVGIFGNVLGFSEFSYVITHATYEILSNTDSGMKFLNRIPFWPAKPAKDEAVNFLGDPFWGWVGFKLYNNFR